MNSQLWIESSAERRQLWSELIEQIEQFFTEVDSLPVAPSLDQKAIQQSLKSFSFNIPAPPLPTFFSDSWLPGSRISCTRRTRLISAFSTLLLL